MTMSIFPPLATRLAQRLAARKRRVQRAPLGWREAGVLVPLSCRAESDEWFVLFTMRSHTVRTHKGEISFPGGSHDPGDSSLLVTALREAEEEIGLRPEDVEILGALDDVISYGSEYVVTPWVGVIPRPYEFRLSHEEIAELVEVPLSVFRGPGAYRVEHWEVRGRTAEVHFYEWNGYTIWGLTARILIQLTATIFADQPREG